MSWSFRRFLSRWQPSRLHARPSVLALQLERLEDRTLPSTDLLGAVAEPIRVVDPELADAADAEVQQELAPLSVTPPAGVIIPEDAVLITWQGVETYAFANRWIVGFDNLGGTSIEQVSTAQGMLNGLPAGLDLTASSHLGGSQTTLLMTTAPGVTFEQLQSSLSGLPGFRYVEPDFLGWIDSTIPDDPDFTELFGLNNTGQTGGTATADINAPQAWDLTTGSQAVVVGVIDTGVDYNHPDLAANMWTNPGENPNNALDDDGNGFVDDYYGYDFIGTVGDGDPLDDNDHGTHVSGTIGAVGNDGVGIAGVNWDVQIMALKWITANNTGAASDAIQAVNYATMMRLNGVNLLLTSNSWQLGGFSQGLFDAIEDHRDAGILFVAAAGNSSNNNDITPHTPSSYDIDNIIAVAATDHDDNLAGFSSYGATSVDLGAPGVDVYSTVIGNSYDYFSGTSMATPHVAGVAALAWSLDPDATYQEIRDAILAGVDPIATLDGITATGGRLNAFTTLQIIASGLPAPVTVIEEQIVFEADFGHSIYSTADYEGFTVDNTGGVEPGLWHLTTGRGADTGHSEDVSIYFGTGEGAAGGGNFDVGHTAGRITSPDIDLTEADDAELSFNFFMETEDYYSYDVAEVQVSINGVDFTTISSNDVNLLVDPTSGWTTAVCNLADFVGNVVNIRFAFDSVDAFNNNYEGWFIDDVTVVAIQLQRTLTWDGGGADNNWSTPENWLGDQAPEPGDNLIFPAGAAQLSNNNDLALGTTFRSIAFNGGGYTLTGNAITLQNGLVNSAGVNVVNLPITLDGDQTFSANDFTALEVNGTVDNAGFLLTVHAGDVGAVELNNTISGDGGLTKTGAGTLFLAVDNTYTGGTSLDAGRLIVLSDTAVGTGALILQDGTTLQSGGANRTLTNSVTVAGNVTLSAAFNLTLSGPITLTGNRTLTVDNVALTTLSGVIGQSGGTWSLTKEGLGTLVLSKNNTYGGGTILSAGALAVGNNGAAGTGALILNGGTLRADGAARTLSNAITLGGNVTFGGSFGLTLSGPVALTGNRTLTVTNTATTTISGIIGESGGSWSLTKTGSKTLVLSGNNEHSGGTILNGGVLGIGNNGAAGTGTLILQSGTIRANGAARILSNAVTLAGNFTIGGSFALTLSGPATLTGNRTITVNNSALTTISGNVGQSGGVWKLIKAGAGTLMLSGVNSYTGSTVVNAGVLLVDGTQTSSAVNVKSGATLGGAGSVGKVTVQAGGTLSPGSSAAILNTKSVVLNSTSTLAIDLHGTNVGSDHDQVNVTGTVNLGGSTLSVNLGFTPAIGDFFVIINNNGTDAVTSTFAGLAEGGTLTLDGFVLEISYVGGTGNDVVLTRIS